MTAVLVPAVKIVVYATVAACSILLVGGAVKKVLTDPADDCLGAGSRIAGTLVGQAAGLLGVPAGLLPLSRA
jgi:hypothetical protein